jgi:chromosomal replication initiation ATPase DnaA
MISLGSISEIVCVVFSVTPAALTGASRMQPVCDARLVGMFLAGRHGHAPKAIAANYKKDVGCVRNAFRRVSALIETDDWLAAKVEECEQLIAKIS